MDSVENIRKNRIRLMIYSIILILMGVALGFLAFKLYQTDKEKSDKEASINNKTIGDNKLLIVSEELLNNYSNYFEKVLSNQEESIKITEAPDGYEGDNNDYLKFFVPAFDLETDIHKYFSNNVLIDDLYDKYDYDSNTIGNYDEVKPIYTKYEDHYYIDGICNATGNKALFSNFKVVERDNDKATLNYQITIMSIVNDEILETYDNAVLELVYEEGSWKINKGTVLGRCGLTYNVK